MKKFFISFFYLFLHPSRGWEAGKLYRNLHGKYKYVTIFAHIFKEAVYQRRHLKNKSKANPRILAMRPTIINIHDGILRTGGLTDRLKGMCTLYNFAKKNNFDFRVFFSHPFTLQKYLVPNSYNWIIDERLISYDLNTTAIYTWENEKFVQNFFELNKYKTQLHVSCNSWECTKDYSKLFHELFKPSPYLYSKINEHLDNLRGSRKYISISLRFQNLLGEFAEGKSFSLSIENQKILIEQCLKKIDMIKNTHSDIDKVLITSDSNLFRDIASGKYGYIYSYIIPEEIGHMDYSQPGRGKELTAFIDMFLIANAKKAYQVRSSDMYNSDFPHMAARINNTPYEMVMID